MQNQTEQHRAHKRRRISLPQSPSRMDVSANIRKLRQREPLSATLILNEPDGPDDLDRAEELGAVQLGINGKGDNIKARGEIGILSEDLFTELFPSSSSSSLNQEKEESATGNDQIFHVAICLWLPSVICTPQTAKWTILPVMKARSANMMTGTEGQRHSSLKVSSISIAGKSVLRNVERGDLLNNAGLPGLEAQQTSEISAQIRIVDVVPVGLETVFVRIDAGALRKLYTMQAKYGGGFAPESRKNASKKKVQSSNHVHASNMNGDTTISMNRMEHADGVEEYEAQWEYAVRNALKSSRIIRTGDLLPLPLPAHPVTHVPPPPAKVLACEPVSQGIIMPNTRIVMIKGGVSAGTGNTSRTALLTKMPDMNNSQMNISLEKGVTPDDLLSSETSDTDNGDLSDDSENTFSLSSLPLTSQSAGFSSSLSYVTSQPIGSLADGTASPGSVASAFTTSTVRPGCGASSGRTLRTQGLLQAIPDELLQPSPSTSDDEEARVYVESKILVKLQCFSGDWVSMEATVDPSVMHRKIGMRVSEGLMQKHVQGPIRRAVKLFSLPGGHLAGKNKQKSATPERRDRSSSFSDAFLVPSQPIVYLSPILLASLGEPSHVKISPITSTVAARAIGQYNVHKSSVNSSSLPPFANEVTLLKLASPVSTDRALQPSLFAGLRKYFERKRRIAKDGDLVGIAFDESLGRALYDGSAAEDGATSNTELLLSANKMKDGWMDDDNVAALQVAWFRIKHTGIASSEGSCEEDDGSSNASPNDKEDVWGGVVCIDSSNTKMVQAGSEVGRLPSALTNSWQYYLGTKKLPANNVISSVKGLIISDMPTPYVSPLRHRVRQLLESATSERAIYFGLPPSATLLTSTQRHMGKATVAIQACEDLGLHVFSIDAFDIVAESSGGADVKSEGLLKARAERAFSCGVQNIVLLIRHVEALNAERMINALKEIIEDSRAIIFTTTEVEKVPENLRSLFTHELEMTAPDEKEREGLLRDICQNYGVRLASDVNLANTALKTAALVSGDLVDVVERALIARRERLDTLASFASTNVQSTKEETFRSSDSIATSMDVELAGGDFALAVTKADFETAVSAARKTFADAIGAPKIPNVSWSDVGGLAHVKSAVMETIHLPLSRPELFAKGLKKRSGILFYGPPGTGKTLVAKAIATEFSLNFFSVKGPELLNMYIGESEANVRRVFQRARDARPCVVFFDELDSVAPKRGNQGDSGGVMDRIVSQLLSELDGMSGGSSSGGSDGKRGDPEGTATGSSGVFVIGATNRPDLLDQALLRPGRFDKMLYLGVADTHEKQLKIVEALTRKYDFALFYRL